MTEAELLTEVKKGLGITGNYQDGTITIYVNDVKAFMLSSGVRQDIINSAASVGVIVRGVADLWNLGSGSAKLSEYFKQRVTQLAAAPDPVEAVV